MSNETISPDPEAVRERRKAVGLSQAAAAHIVHSGLRTWQQWEAGARRMHPAFWELFQIKTEVPRVETPVDHMEGS
ncbi:XRE family transcriptional regulator [Caballeronia sp. LP003]|uniref:helix-turn-helix domain-containing protein n=1 Tax=Caballeronia sp. LP003 TaxID=3038551 RepID=UPI002861BFC5|nr:XRE family transcriptional regulator [Caballeronia sp. LP003]MDR5791754.1 XRE family transcriptional regulator [Caballeronia sp. LP003]